MRNELSIVIEGIPTTLQGYTLYTGAINQLVDQRRALVTDDWVRVEELANQGLGSFYGSYREIRRFLGVLDTLDLESKQHFIGMLKEHAKDDETRAAFFAKVKEDLLQLNPEIGEDYLKGLDDLAEGKTSNNDLLNLLKPAGAVSDSAMEDSAIEAAVALAVRSLMSLTFANFQSHYTTYLDHVFSGPYLNDEFLNVLQDEVNMFAHQLAVSTKRLHNTLVMGLSPESTAEELAGNLEESLPRFGRLQATMRLYAIYLKKENKGAASEKVGELSARAGSLTRSALSSHASAYYLSLQSRKTAPKAKAAQLIAKAASLAFEVDLPNGKNTEISKTGQLADGDYVEVAGFVKAIQTGRDTDNKLITQVTLYDPSSNAEVVAAGIFVHLVHVGLSVDSFCRLSGTWRPTSGLNSGNPAIEIEKLPVNELSAVSWKVSFEDLSDKFIDRWPGGLNISYGLSPHFSGEEEGDSEVLGAGELIYRPFLR